MHLDCRPLVKAAREIGALAFALGIWAGISLLIVAFAWQATSAWWYFLLPLYLPAPVAAFLYVFAVRPSTRDNCIKRAVFLASLGWILGSPIPIYPLFGQFTRAFVFFGVVPTSGEDPLLGVFFYSLLSFVLVGIPYCGYSSYWAGKWASRVLHRKAPNGASLRRHRVHAGDHRGHEVDDTTGGSAKGAERQGG